MSNFNKNISSQLEEYFLSIKVAKSYVEDIQKQQWTTETSEKYCSERGIDFTEALFNQTSITIKNLKNFDYDEMIEKLNGLEKYAKMISDNLKEWDKYNVPYQKYVTGKLSQQISELSKISTVQSSQNFHIFINNIVITLMQLNDNINLSIDELFENFKYGDKNYVVFGKNGAGKTTLLNKIASAYLNDNSFVIPANRFLKIEIGDYIGFYPNLHLKEIFNTNDAVFYLTRKLKDLALDNYKYGINPSNPILLKFENIFNSLDLERNILIEGDLLYLYTENNKSNKYYLANGSDGEKVIAYFLLVILLLPQNAFVFIDEPECHLNGALMQKLFNMLEKERSDLKFVYVTHIINFVESRKNVELIYLEKTKNINFWKFKKIDEFDNSDVNMVLSIEGTQDDIIFCEGNQDTSIDKKILEVVYNDCFVKPVFSCQKVIDYTKCLNENGKYSFLRRKAFGVIDNDFRDEQQINILKNENITILKYNEWENLLLCKEVIEFVNRKTGNYDIEETKRNIIIEINNGKNFTIEDYLNKRYYRIIMVKKVKYGKTLESDIDDLNKKNKTEILTEIEEFQKKFEKFVTDNNYEELLTIVPAKRIFNFAAKQLGFNNKDAYVNRIIVLLNENEEFKQLLKSKIAIERN